ncbi:O-antigen ligase family protein [Microbacterium sp. NPDC055683]
MILLTTAYAKVKANLNEFNSIPLHTKLVLAAVALMPFQSAFTIDVGAPLKASEILAFASLITLAFTWRRRTRPRTVSPDIVCVAILGASVILAAVGPLLSAEISAPIRGTSRSGLLDILLYTVYGIFALAIWLLVRQTDASLLLKALRVSIWLCLCAIGLQVWFRLAGWGPLLSAVGFDMTPRGLTFLGATFSRSGPFVEGQHLGFYAGAVLVVMLYSRNYASAVAAAVCVTFSESTTGLAGAAIAIIAVVILRPNKIALMALGGAALASAAAVAISAGARDFVFLQLAKIGLITLPTGNPMKSLDVRSAKAEIAWRMMWDHLPFGVGPGRYAVYFGDYQDAYNALDGVYGKSSRPIVENGYFQIGAELGPIALLAFVVLVAWLAWRSWRTARLPLALITFIAIGFATQSSWTFPPILMLLGIVASFVRTGSAQHRAPAEPSELSDAPPPATLSRKQWRDLFAAEKPSMHEPRQNEENMEGRS